MGKLLFRLHLLSGYPKTGFHVLRNCVKATTHWLPLVARDKIDEFFSLPRMIDGKAFFLLDAIGCGVGIITTLMVLTMTNLCVSQIGSRKMLA